jgi:predicted PP-loop superfamily ATPase
MDTLPKKEIDKAKKHLKRYSISLVIREMRNDEKALHTY